MSDGPRRPARCVCGHDRAAHRHYRRGTDCTVCGPDRCPRYRRRRWWRRSTNPVDRPGG